ncbi:hypothetical protein TRFO_17057 [Tritrichomonas foetus]|uniref:UBA domain-containing protein n=1 Tax=Tritrichomonas foetus TaxID=1144522 RepID=A0A1J4KTD2_9EUKA|nr:hypothetical protein TRFO_17057 [Tritrichomonas foetus]|eukprot:OHT12910.1 hypothetical protein TRFO_17057 [Tritrichomonas foetus]
MMQKRSIKITNIAEHKYHYFQFYDFETVGDIKKALIAKYDYPDTIQLNSSRLLLKNEQNLQEFDDNSEFTLTIPHNNAFSNQNVISSTATTTAAPTSMTEACASSSMTSSKLHRASDIDSSSSLPKPPAPKKQADQSANDLCSGSSADSAKPTKRLSDNPNDPDNFFEKVDLIKEMGFTNDEETIKEALRKHDYNISYAVAYIISNPMLCTKMPESLSEAVIKKLDKFTENERNEINKFVDEGHDQDQVVQVFEACGRDASSTRNILNSH